MFARSGYCQPPRSAVARPAHVIREAIADAKASISDQLRNMSPAQRRAAVSALALHLIVAAVLARGIVDVRPVQQRTAGALAVFDVGLSDVPAGDINGHDAPPAADTPKPEPRSSTATSPVELPVMAEAPGTKSLAAAVAVEPGAEPLAPASAISQADVGSGTLALGAKVASASGLDGTLAAAIGQAVATQISACWDAPRDRLPNDFAIVMSVQFSETGDLVGEPTILRIEEETATAVSQPSRYEAAAIAAVKRCAPIRLPAHLYVYWRDVQVQVFSSRQDAQLVSSGPLASTH